MKHNKGFGLDEDGTIIRRETPMFYPLKDYEMIMINFDQTVAEYEELTVEELNDWRKMWARKYTTLKKAWDIIHRNESCKEVFEEEAENIRYRWNEITAVYNRRLRETLDIEYESHGAY